MTVLESPRTAVTVPGLGWPRPVTVDPAIGWPVVPRETDPPASAPEVSPPAAAPEQPREAPGEAPERTVLEVAPGASVDPSTPAQPEGPQDGLAPIAAAVEHLDQPDPATAAENVQGTPPPVAPPDDVPRETAPRVEALPAPPSTRVLVVANQKGGVGKTTTAVNVATALALGGLAVTVIDLDPQGNASTALGVEHSAGTPGTYEVLIEGDPVEQHLVTSPEAPRLQVLPATIDLAGAEIELVSVIARENRLKRALSAYLASADVDYVFLDCPPSLGLLTLNALVAATEILLPIQCEYYALEGVSQLMRTVELVQADLNADLRVSTVLLTMYDARTRLAAQVADEVRAHFAAETIPTVIPRSVRISEAPSYGTSVLNYHPESAGAVSYLDAAREIARRGAAKEHP